MQLGMESSEDPWVPRHQAQTKILLLQSIFHHIGIPHGPFLSTPTRPSDEIEAQFDKPTQAPAITQSLICIAKVFVKLHKPHVL
jgi:hypothetical protein